MFVVEKLVQDYHNRVEAWTEARDKWVANGSEYGYRSNRDYERSHPRPGTGLKTAGRAAIVVLAILAAAAFTVGLAVSSGSNDSKHPKPKAAPVVVVKDGDKCGDFKMGDHVRIQFGDEEGDTGTIIGGCSSREDYQIKLDKDQKDGYGNNRGGQTISVDSNNNLVVVQK